VDEKLLEDIARRVRARPELMRRRQQLSEAPFGTIKRAMNQDYLLMKGLDKVAAEMTLTVLTYNLKRAIKIVGVPKLIAALSNLVIRSPAFRIHHVSSATKTENQFVARQALAWFTESSLSFHTA